MRRFIKNCKCDDLNVYARNVLRKKIRVSKEIYSQYALVKKEFEKGNIEVDLDLYEKYIKIGFLFFPEIFDWQRAETALYLCTFYKGTRKPRWNKIYNIIGRGSGKDGMIAWWSLCLTSEYHGVEYYDIDIIANNYDQARRPLNDIVEMCKHQGKRMDKFYSKIGDSVISLKTTSYITARSSDATQQDGLRSGAVIFNEIHAYENYRKLNVMISGLGKKPDPRQAYFTTNGEVRGSVVDDVMEKAQRVLTGQQQDRRTLYFIYKIDEKNEVHDPKNWIKANPSIDYMPQIREEIEDEYDIWNDNPNAYPAFLQKRFNLPEMPSDIEVVPWEVLEKTEQEYDYKNLEGMTCVVGIDLSKTTDWTAVNFLFYDDEIDKFICLNHAFVCSQSKDLQGIKAPYQEWCNEGLITMVDEKEVEPETVIEYILEVAEANNYNIECIAIDEFKKGVMKRALEENGFSQDGGNLEIVRPMKIAPMVPVIESYFIQERFVWNNRMLMWATNNTKVIPWKAKTTGNNDLGNQLYGKINPRFRKTDPFMAFVHSMVKSDVLIDVQDYTDRIRGF